MKLYATIKSERGKAEGKGGQEFLDIEITDANLQAVASIKILPGEKIRVTVGVNKDLALLEVSDSDSVCTCTDPLCAKCLLVNCKDPNCKIHPESKKKEFREFYANRK